MRIKTYETKGLHDGRVIWTLGACNLYDYLSGLRPDFFDFDIQRRIVKNDYLDKIWHSVLDDDPMPAFSFTSTSKISDNRLDMTDIEILDGLQRTYRLWAIYYLDSLLQGDSDLSFDEIYSLLKQSSEGHRLIDCKVLNRSKIRKLTADNNALLKRIIVKYKDYDITFNVWSGLTDEEIVAKMLTLNAGQRSVTSTHQYELMFLHYFKSISWSDGIKIIREKDPRYNDVKNGNRRQGEFLMSSVVIAMQSYIQNRPLRINQVNKLRIDDDIVEERSSGYFSQNKIVSFVKLLQAIERKFNRNSDIQAWMLKDTTLSGLFAAIGLMVQSSEDFNNSEITRYIEMISPENVKWNEFQKSYQELSSMSTNVGNAVRKACFRYFKNLFIQESYPWHRAFTDKNEKK